MASSRCRPTERARIKIGDVRTSDEEHEPNGSEKHPERATVIFDAAIVQPNDFGSDAGIRVWIFALQARCDGLHLRNGFFEGHAVRKTREDAEPLMVASIAGGIVVRPLL